MLLYIIAVLVSILSFFLLDIYFSNPFIIDLLITYGVISTIFYGRIFYTIICTKNKQRIEQFLKKSKRDPYYSFLYALANKDDQQLIATYRKLLNRRRYKKHYPLLTVQFSLYFNQIDGVEEEIKLIFHRDFRLFYQTVLLIERNELEQAKNDIPLIRKRWMREVLLSGIAHKEGKEEEEKFHAKCALEHTKGVQFYMVHKEFERLFSGKI